MQIKRALKDCLLVKTVSLFILLTVSSGAFGQLTPISLEQRIEQSTIVFEGKVVSKKSFWDQAHTHIYTSNVVSVYKVFKGSTTAEQVEIITPGGIVGNQMETVSHTLQLTVGDIGVFTAIPSPVKSSSSSKLLRLKPYSGAQGFIEYNLEDNTAKDAFRTYKTITGEVYSEIKNQTKLNIKTIQKADFQIGKL